jgi:flagellar motility protein MotE (MotC chaperone)
MKLSPRLASAILNEMDSKKAAGLTGIIASAAAPDLPKDPS